MALPHPSSFHPELTSDRLALISKLLLEELYSTEDALSTDTDDGYTRGCTIFGRQKNRIKMVARSGEHEWLTLANGGNDLVFNIGGVPCRFSNDDPASPSKLAVLAVNRYQADFLEETEMGAPCRFCFVIDHGVNENTEARVFFMGFDATGILRCQWISDGIRTIHSVEPQIPAPIEVSKPSVTPKRPAVGDEDIAASS